MRAPIRKTSVRTSTFPVPRGLHSHIATLPSHQLKQTTIVNLTPPWSYANPLSVVCCLSGFLLRLSRNLVLQMHVQDAVLAVYHEKTGTHPILQSACSTSTSKQAKPDGGTLAARSCPHVVGMRDGRLMTGEGEEKNISSQCTKLRVLPLHEISSYRPLCRDPTE
jgi:hypothetical protein